MKYYGIERGSGLFGVKNVTIDIPGGGWRSNLNESEIQVIILHTSSTNIARTMHACTVFWFQSYTCTILFCIS